MSLTTGTDATGAPRPFVNAKGKRRRPSTRTLGQMLKCDDELFIDFISRCLTWDPDKRLKPQPALRHPWILAGRRGLAPAPSTSMSRPSSLSGHAVSSSTSSARLATGPSRKDPKSLLISPPTPLMARQVPMSAPRMTGGGSALRLANGQVRAGGHLVNLPERFLESELIRVA